jgi:hypothetical protein
MLPDDDLDGDLGTLDVVSMDEIRSAFTGLDGLVEEAGFPNLADPQVLKIWFPDGIGNAGGGRFDMKCYRKGYYSFHYTDSTGRNFRWDHHPKAGAPTKHFHPPPDAPSRNPEPSCISVVDPPVVARVVHKLWRRAYDTGSTEGLNSAEGDL